MAVVVWSRALGLEGHRTEQRNLTACPMSSAPPYRPTGYSFSLAALAAGSAISLRLCTMRPGQMASSFFSRGWDQTSPPHAGALPSGSSGVSTV